MEKKEIDKLILAYLNGTATGEQRKIIELHYLDYLDKAITSPTQEQVDRSFEQTYCCLLSEIKPYTKPTRKLFRLRVLPYAAAILLIFGIIGALYVKYGSPIDSVQLSNMMILPAGNRAILTVDGEKPIVLDETQDGIVMKDGAIQYNDGGAIVSDTHSVKRYTLQTPKGGTYQLQLADGTKVWLNADSHVSYSADFGHTPLRQVQLQGEAYFEVAKHKNHPFVVETAKERVEVLGTHFNVNTYPDELTSRTTLLEGSVRVNSSVVLVPGQQAIVGTSGDLRVIPVDTQQVIAWRMGKFVFESEALESVMQKIGRWYNVDIIYKGSVSNKTFSGTVSRFEDIHKLLDVITYTSGVQFKLEGRRITVMP